MLDATQLREQGAELLRQKRFSEAVEVLQRAAEYRADDEGTWRLLGAALGQSGDAAGSVSAFQRAVTLAPTSAKNHYNLALALQNDSRISEARQHLERALALDPSYEQARTRLRELSAAATPPPIAGNGLSSLGGGAPVEETAAPPAPSVTPIGSYTAPGGYVPPASLTGGQQQRYSQPSGLSAGRVVLGVVAAMVAGTIGCVIWWTLVLTTGFIGFRALTAIGVGWLMGQATKLGCGEAGETPALIAAIVGGLTLLLNLVVLFIAAPSVIGAIFSVFGLIWGVQQAYKTASE